MCHCSEQLYGLDGDLNPYLADDAQESLDDGGDDQDNGWGLW